MKSENPEIGHYKRIRLEDHRPSEVTRPDRDITMKKKREEKMGPLPVSVGFDCHRQKVPVRCFPWKRIHDRLAEAFDVTFDIL